MAHMPIRHTVASCSQGARTLPRILFTTGRIMLNNVLEPARSASGRRLWAVPCLKGSADTRRAIQKKNTYVSYAGAWLAAWTAGCRTVPEFPRELGQTAAFLDQNVCEIAVPPWDLVVWVG